MRAGWDTLTLEELCNFKNGLWKGKKGPLIEAGVIRNTNFTKDGRLDDTNIAYLEVEEKHFRTRRLEHGDLILEKSGGGPKQPVGRVIVFERRDGNYSFSNFTSIIRIKEPNRLYFRFLHWYLHFLYLSGATEPMQKHSTNIRNLQLKEYKRIAVPLPSLKEQKRIVAILDEAFAGIETAVANTEKNLANARELFSSFLATLLANPGNDWRFLTLKKICSDYGRGKSKHRPRNDPMLYGGAYPFIQTGDVRRSDHKITSYAATYNENGLEQSKLWPKGTICITIAANIAETGILDFDACFPDSIIGLVVDESNASREYVEFLLQSLKAVLKAKGKGSAQDNINLGTFESETFPFPPLEIQNDIVQRVDELRRSVRQFECVCTGKLKAFEELKQSLLQKAFSGELTADRAQEELESTTATA